MSPPMPQMTHLKWFNNLGMLLPVSMVALVKERRRHIEDAFTQAADLADGRPMVVCMFENGILVCTEDQAKSNCKDMGVNVRPVFTTPKSEHVLWIMLEISDTNRYALQINIAVQTVKINASGGSA